MEETFWRVFFEVYEALPRQGPGSKQSAARALAVCAGLPDSPAVLDLGCGTGGQTLHLVELTGGSVLAVDEHEASIARLSETIVELGLDSRVRARIGDMGAPDFGDEPFDLIWSEGALYNIGLPNALELYFPHTNPGGYMVFTEPLWLKDKRPDEVNAAFEADYPSMAGVAEAIRAVEASPFTLVEHFTLPDEDWWTDFYTPMEQRIEQLRAEYKGDADAMKALDEIANEPAMHREHGNCYGYEFFVCQRGNG